MRRMARENGWCQVDGTRDRPPGKTAENWGRKDGIRAGSVSGPWRSAPRDTGVVSPERPLVHPSTPARAARAVSVPGEHHNAAAEGYVRHNEHELGRSRNRRLMGSVVWIAFGAVVAISCIVAAFVSGPTRPSRHTLTRRWRNRLHR